MRRTPKEIVDILVEDKVFTHHPKASNFYKVVLRPLIWSELLDGVFTKYPDLKKYSDTFPTTQEFLYCVTHNLQEPPKCPVCGSNCKFETNGGRYYRDTCCNIECQNELKKQRCLEKYGVDNPSQLKWVQEKKEQTCLKNYGAKIPFQTERVKRINKEIWETKGGELLKKQKEGMLKKYGVENMSQVPEFQKKKAWRYYYDNERFDSKPELAYYIYLKDNNIPFTFHTDRLEYFEENKKHYYYPDFKVEGGYVEIKSPIFFNEKGEPWDPYHNKFWWGKYNCMRAYSVLIQTDKEYTQYLDYIAEKYGKYYLDQFKIDPQTRKESLGFN